MFSFAVKKRLNKARLTELRTPHGRIDGPFFQFVATQAGIRGQVYSDDLEKLGVQIVLANTYHLHVRPGEDLVREAGGLHQFMQWDRPIITDSGGYQVFSLGQHLQIDDDGVTFREPRDGSKHRLTPEITMQIEHKLGADIVMPLDIATAYDAEEEEVKNAVEKTYRWAKRCQAEHSAINKSQQRSVLYGIVQGGLYPHLRKQAAEQLGDLNFFGYSIGGELRDRLGSRMDDGVEMTVGHLPQNKPRYLMGAGSPADIVRAVRRGVDQFDCVLPIRDARHGRLYRRLNLEQLQKYLVDPELPVEAAKLCEIIDIKKTRWAHDMDVFAPLNPAIIKPYSIAYVQHLMRVEPPSGYRLAVLNNIHFYQQLMESIRGVINEFGS